MAINALNFGSKVVFVNNTPLTLPIAASDPGSPTAGYMYYNSTSGLVRFYNGISTAWQNVNDGGVATNITATSNATLTTLSSLSLPYSQITGGPATGANTALSNLASTAVNASITPASDNTITLGGLSNRWQYVAATSVYAIDSGGTTGVGITNAFTLPSTSSSIAGLEALGTSSMGVSTATNNAADANPTGSLFLETGNKGAGTGNSGNITVYVGTSSGGSRGLIQLRNGSEGTAGQVWTSTDTNGSGHWAASSGGTVSTVSVTSANGFAGTVATATTTPAITISTTINSPVLAGNGTAISAATTTGTGSTVVLSASPSITGTLSTAAISASGALNMNSNQINSLAMAGSPAGTDATNVTYVNAQIASAINGLSWKGPVQAYANSNTALTGGATLTIDSYSVQNGDWVILGNQTLASQNYVYVASGIGTAYTLTQVVGSEAPTAVGDAYLIEKGAVFGNSAYQVNAISPNVTFIQFAGPNTYIFTTPLSVTGNTVSIGYDNSTIGVTGGNLYVLNNGINTAQLASSSVTYAKIQNESASTLLGNPTGSTAAPSEIALGATLTFSGSTLETSAMTGDITTSTNSFATTLATVNASPGTYAISTVTVNGKGLVTSATAATTTGSGSVVLATSPTLTTPNIGAATATSISSTGVLSINANSGASALQIEALNVQRSVDGTNFVTETYVDSTTLTDNTTAAVAAFQFTTASFAGVEITYAIESGDANADCRIGTIRVTANNSGTITPSLADMYVESADCGVTWSASNSSGTISVSYTTTLQSANRTMRADVKFIRR